LALYKDHIQGDVAVVGSISGNEHFHRHEDSPPKIIIVWLLKNTLKGTRTLICCVAVQTDRSTYIHIRLVVSGFLRALQLNIFEQP